jgi:hypothetical protein
MDDSHEVHCRKICDLELIVMTSKQAPLRTVEGLLSLDDILIEDGVLEEFQAVAIEEVLIWQLANAMRVGSISLVRPPILRYM